MTNKSWRCCVGCLIAVSLMAGAPTALLGLAGPGFLLMLVAWFLVSSKVRNRSAGDFLQLVADIASQPPPESGASERVEGELANRTPEKASGRAGD